MTERNIRIAISEEFEVVRQALEEAEVLLQKNLYRGSVSRSYYAVYHAATALVLTKGLEPKSHGGLIHLVSRDFVKPGILDTKVSRLLSKMQAFREDADYEADILFTKADAANSLKDARAFCKGMRGFVRKTGYLKGGGGKSLPL